jgi:hypothetical protein
MSRLFTVFTPGLAIAVAIVAAPLTSVGDDGTSYKDYLILSQQGDGVDVGLKFDSSSPDPEPSEALTLERETAGSTESLLHGEVLPAEDVIEVKGPYCDEPVHNELSCVEYPLVCDDCNGDGEPDCLFSCRYVQYYLLQEDCVPPGEATYTLWVGGSSEPWDEETIDVENVGQPCRDDGCSVSGVGAGPSARSLIGLFMVVCGIALVFVFRGRR